jgi:hypothetical protein
MRSFLGIPLVMSFDSLGYWLVAGVVLLFILLLIRETAIWFFKINEIVERLERIERNTRKREQDSIIKMPAQSTPMVLERPGPKISAAVEYKPKVTARKIVV